MSDAFWMALFGFLATALNIIISKRSNATSNENKAAIEEVNQKVNGHLVEAINKATDEARRVSAPRILIIDDDKMDIELAANVLRKFGCDIFEARSADEAERLLLGNIGPGRGFPFDFVLLDLKMPGGATDEVFQIFNEKAPRVPIVILTGQPGSSSGSDLADKPRIWIIKPLTGEHVKSLFDQFSIPYHKSTESKTT